jgi:hypothetical protein
LVWFIRNVWDTPGAGIKITVAAPVNWPVWNAALILRSGLLSVSNWMELTDLVVPVPVMVNPPGH